MLTAMHSGRCNFCGNTYPTGTEIEKGPDGWRHVRCPSNAPQTTSRALVPSDPEGQALYADQSDRIAKAYYANKYFPFVEEVLAGKKVRQDSNAPQHISEMLTEVRSRLVAPAKSPV